MEISIYTALCIVSKTDSCCGFSRETEQTLCELPLSEFIRCGGLFLTGGTGGGGRVMMYTNKARRDLA